jgi:DNA-binding response OmpR family regulator
MIDPEVIVPSGGDAISKRRSAAMFENPLTGPDETAVLDAKRAKKILVVDDEDALVRLIQLQLKFEGYQVITAYDGLEALEKVVSEKPDLVVLDIMMPKVDGWVVCHSIKSNTDTKNIRVIILTAMTQFMSRFKGLYVFQAELYMSKPFDLEALSTNISKLLNIEEEALGVAPKAQPAVA